MTADKAMELTGTDDDDDPPWPHVFRNTVKHPSDNISKTNLIFVTRLSPNQH